MLTLLLLFAFQVASPGEMACIGSIQELTVPEDVYVAGVKSEGLATVATQGQVLYLNGPGVSSLKMGSVHRVVRPEGRIRDPRTRKGLGTYYKDIGTLRIEAVDQESAVARVLLSCEGMLKGDLVISSTPRPAVEFSGDLSGDLTPFPRGLSSSILLAKNDARQLGAGQFCFIQAGKLDGVKPGDRFTIFRRQPAFNSRDMAVAGTAADSTYASIRGPEYAHRMGTMLRGRILPPRAIGDIVIVEVGDGISTGKIISSTSEISPGDVVVKR